jgi:hypothetical protein
MTTVLYAVVQQSDDIADGARRDDDLRNQAIGAGIGGVADQVDGAVQNLAGADQFTQRLAQVPRRTEGPLFGNAIFGRVARRTTDPGSVWL